MRNGEEDQVAVNDAKSEVKESYELDEESDDKLITAIEAGLTDKDIKVSVVETNGRYTVILTKNGKTATVKNVKVIKVLAVELEELNTELAKVEDVELTFGSTRDVAVLIAEYKIDADIATLTVENTKDDNYRVTLTHATSDIESVNKVVEITVAVDPAIAVADGKIEIAIAKIPAELELAFETEITVSNVKSAIEAIDGIELADLDVVVTSEAEGNYKVAIRDTAKKGTERSATVKVTVSPEDEADQTIELGGGVSAVVTGTHAEITYDGEGTGLMQRFLMDFEPFRDTGILTATVGEGVVNIGKAAFGGTKLTEVSLPSTLKRIDKYAFSMTALTDVVIPEGVTGLRKYKVEHLLT